MEAVFSFLRGLAGNNNRDWFEAHRADYDAARAQFLERVEAVRTALLPLEPRLADQQSKDLVFRIYRDVRFSADKRPYKTGFGAYYCRAGRKAPDAGYYLHAEPGRSFFAAGMWMPEGPLLKAVRQEMDYAADEFSALLSARDFRKTFPQGLEGERLKKPPVGYAPDHPLAEHLRLKSFTVTHALPNDALTPKTCAAVFATAKPLVDFLNRAVDAG